VALACLAASLAFAWKRSARTPAVSRDASVSGRALFQRDCSGCHDGRELAIALEAEPDRASAVLQRLDFLASHGDSTPAEDRAIVAYLLSAQAREE
jgi:mono/diheme cytochrome c family protein